MAIKKPVAGECEMCGEYAHERFNVKVYLDDGKERHVAAVCADCKKEIEKDEW